MRPKLFKYRLDSGNRAAKYEFSSVELNAEHPICVDYNMGVRIDLIDREVYAIKPQHAFIPATSNEENLRLAEALKTKLFSERDKFLLSDQDTLPIFNLAG